MGLFYAQSKKIKYQSRQKKTKSNLLPVFLGFTIETDKIFSRRISYAFY